MGSSISRWNGNTGEETLIDAQALKGDEPLRLANFLLANPMEKLKSGYWNDWAKKTAKTINCALQRLCNMYGYSETCDVHDPSFRKAWHVCQRAKTKKHKERLKYSGDLTILFGLEVPCNVREALELDRKNGNHRGAEAIHKEMKRLQDQ